MSAEVVGLKGDTVPSVISAFTVAAARSMKTIIRKAAGTKWWLLLTIAVGTILTVFAIKPRTNTAGVSTAPGNGSQIGVAPRTGPVTTSLAGSPAPAGRSVPPAEPPGSTPPKPPAFPDSIGSKGGLWIGTIHGDKTVTYTGPPLVVHHYTNTIKVRLREVVGGVISSSDPARFHRIGSRIDLINEGSQYEGDYQGTPCSDRVARSYTGENPMGSFWYKTLNEPVKNGNDIPPEGLYRLEFGDENTPPKGCQGRHAPMIYYDLGGRPIEIGYLWGPGSAPPDRAKLQADDWDPEGYRKMSQNHTRMVGDYTYENQFQDGSERVKVDWDIYLMGKCAERDGPIQEDDPVVQNEDVHIDAENSDITPDGKTKVRIRVTCDGVPVEGAKVKIEVEPVDSSGGHIHVNNRPKGKLDGKDLTGANPSITLPTDQKGTVKGPDGITFAPPGKEAISRCLGLAGDYKVTATSEKFNHSKESTMILVRFQGLTMLPQGQNYDICADSVNGCQKAGPWGTPDHPDSEYGTAGTIQAFQSVATDFWNQEQSHNQLLHACGKTQWPMVKVSFNDIALPWGGLFDMNSTWKQPHKTHGKGQGGDFNHFKNETCKNETGNNAPCLSCGGATVNFDAFLWNLLKYTAQPKYGHWDGEVNSSGELHLHVEDQGQGPPSSCPADN